jgi:hypothetical protein
MTHDGDADMHAGFFSTATLTRFIARRELQHRSFL